MCIHLSHTYPSNIVLPKYYLKTKIYIVTNTFTNNICIDNNLYINE